MTSHDTPNHKTWVEVSKKALLNNAKIVRGLLKPGVRLMAVVKSNAYGHGFVETAKLFSNSQLGDPTAKLAVGSPSADWLGVDNIDEAILLRRNGIKNPILVLGYTSVERIKKSAICDLRFTIYDADAIEGLSYNLKPITYNLHLKVDTGMSRQGVTLADLPRFLKNLPRGTSIEGAYTHFANADNLGNRSYPNLQLANFKKALVILNKHGITPKIVHTSATTGLLTMPEAHFDMVRIGLALYGLWPSQKFAQKFKKFGLEPSLAWKTRIVQIKKIKKGTPVGYGITEKVKKDSTIAALPVGYYDGYDRGLSSVGEVLVGGRRCKILGRISMNLSVIDVSVIKNSKVWDEVILIGNQGGEQITAEELAKKIGTISCEITSRINPLLPRAYL